MLKQCRAGKIDLILVKSISRFARNTLIVLEQVRKLKMLGVEVYFENENIRTLPKDGEFMLSVLSAYAEEESRSASENIKWSVRRWFQKGKVKINVKRFPGYDLDEYGDLVLNLKESQIVQRIFEDYLRGKGTHVIAKELNQANIPTITGGQWRDNAILYILKNEKYKGDALLQKTYIKDHLDKRKIKNTGEVEMFYVKENHSPIVTQEMWDKVQEELRKRRKNKGPSQNRYDLSGKLICSKCGNKLKRRTWNSGKSCKKIVWQCSKYISEGKHACEGTVIADELIQELNIEGETVIKEMIVNGEKHYTYTSKEYYSN